MVSRTGPFEPRSVNFTRATPSPIFTRYTRYIWHVNTSGLFRSRNRPGIPTINGQPLKLVYASSANWTYPPHFVEITHFRANDGVRDAHGSNPWTMIYDVALAVIVKYLRGLSVLQ